MPSEKISAQLAETLKQTDSEGLVDLIVELADPPFTPASGSRARQIEARKEAFSQHAAPTADQIERLGGQVTGRAWINGSMSARLSKNMIAALSGSTRVKRLDLPRKLQADQSA